MDEDEGGAAAMGEATAMEVDGGEETGGESEMMSSQGSAGSGTSVSEERRRSGKVRKRAGAAQQTGNQRGGLGTAERKRRARETASEAGTPT